MKEYPAGAQPQAEDQAAAAVDYAAAEACTAAIIAGPGEADLTPAEIAALEALDPAELDQLARDFNTAVILVGAGYGKWPDVGNHEIPCCTATAVMGHAWCTCWEPLYDAEQAPARTDLPAGMQPAMCTDCAYRPKSPERTGDPDADDGAKHDAEDLQHFVVTGSAFWCHQGMRRPRVWRHPTTGAVVLGSPHDYKPLTVDRIPYQADGTPGLLCAGWVALRTKHLQQGTLALGDGQAHRFEGGTFTELVAPQPESNNRSNDADEALTLAERVYLDPMDDGRTCRVCGCTDDRGCAPINGESCSWVTGADALDSDLCTRCQPLEQLLADPIVDGLTDTDVRAIVDGFDPGTGAWPVGGN